MAVEETENTQVFVVRIWVEPRAQADGRASVPEWRGKIEHVPGGQHRYFHSLRMIEKFIIPYLEEIGVNLSKTREFKRWLQRQLRS